PATLQPEGARPRGGRLGRARRPGRGGVPDPARARAAGRGARPGRRIRPVPGRSAGLAVRRGGRGAPRRRGRPAPAGCAARRPGAATRLGWRRPVEAVGPLLDALTRAVDDMCSILDALGAIGDPRAIPAARIYATRKLLSRRRSAVEALRNLGDQEGLAEATARARLQLPVAMRAALASGTADAVDADAVEAVGPAIRGLGGQ